jgi:hypothetical protein
MHEYLTVKDMRKVFIFLLVVGVLIGTLTGIEGISGDAACEPVNISNDELPEIHDHNTIPDDGGDGGGGGGPPIPG